MLSFHWVALQYDYPWLHVRNGQLKLMGIDWPPRKMKRGCLFHDASTILNLTRFLKPFIPQLVSITKWYTTIGLYSHHWVQNMDFATIRTQSMWRHLNSVRSRYAYCTEWLNWRILVTNRPDCFLIEGSAIEVLRWTQYLFLYCKQSQVGRSI